jgi:DNA-binding NarL/FixJ family response regulator
LLGLKNAALDTYRGETLTEAELAVLICAADGLSVDETAAERDRARETVKSQRRLILAKLAAQSMTHAVAIALREGLID